MVIISFDIDIARFMDLLTSYLPKFGCSLPDRIFSAVLFPIPLVPTSPSTCPAFGVGNRCNLNVFAAYRCVVCDSRFVGKLTIVIASNGHFFGHIPHPIHNDSEMYAIVDVGSTSIHCFPIRTTGHDFLHSCRHFLGLHLSVERIAMRLSLSDMIVKVVQCGEWRVMVGGVGVWGGCTRESGDEDWSRD